MKSIVLGFLTQRSGEVCWTPLSLSLSLSLSNLGDALLSKRVEKIGLNHDEMGSILLGKQSGFHNYNVEVYHKLSFAFGVGLGDNFWCIMQFELPLLQYIGHNI